MSRPAKPTSPAVPDRSDRSTFSDRVAAFLTYISGPLATYTDSIASYLDGLGTSAADTALAAANFKGAWSGLTGALNVPASVSHDGRFWMLTEDVADITTVEPGVSAVWLEIGDSLIIGLREKKEAISASAIDLATGNYFTKTIAAETTFTVANVPVSGEGICFILDLTNGGAFTVNWWTGMTWASGEAPTLTESGRDVLGFFTHDAGTTWNGFVIGQEMGAVA